MALGGSRRSDYVDRRNDHRLSRGDHLHPGVDGAARLADLWRAGVGAGGDAGKTAAADHRNEFPDGAAETGDGAVDMMRTIKKALDPKNILNPGKIFAL